tara:strand:- start:136 stop:966 length:831 start_codon:yes stop_codon:yes gene_type:complete
MSFYYVTCATGKDFIERYSQYAIRSLFDSGIPYSDIYFIGNKRNDENLIRNLIPNIENVYVANEDLRKVKWTYMKGKRVYSLFKIAGLNKFFQKPRPGKHLVYFDGDVLFFKDPTKFLLKYKSKTWFHHGKKNSDCAKKRTGRRILKRDVSMKNYRSLSNWVSSPCAWLMQKHGATKIPDRQVCAGFYILHPNDHSSVLRLTYKYAMELSRKKKFNRHCDVGDQKPMNAALSVLNIDFSGGDRFSCPEHEDYFIHYFGSGAQKKAFDVDLKRRFNY